MCDCEMPSVFNQTRPHARTRHRCCECHGWIERGEHYQYTWGIWDGSASSYKTCPQCAKLHKLTEKAVDCCVPFTGLFEAVHEAEDPALLARFEAIRIQRGAAICPLYQAEENDLSHLTDP